MTSLADIVKNKAQSPRDSACFSGSQAPFHQLIVFDFDWTLVDKVADKYLFEKLGHLPLFKSTKVSSTVTYLDRASTALDKLQEKGVKPEEINEIMGGIGMNKYIVDVLHYLGGRMDTTLICLSNGIDSFINIILESANVDKLFTEVIANPGYWDESRMPHVRPRTKATDPPHDCDICQSNLCKGKELEDYIHRASVTNKMTYSCVTYVGDGSNDLCPVLRLGSKDRVLCRTNFSLHKLIFEPLYTIKATIGFWDNAERLSEFLRYLSPEEVEAVEAVKTAGAVEAVQTVGAVQTVEAVQTAGTVQTVEAVQTAGTVETVEKVANAETYVCL